MFDLPKCCMKKIEIIFPAKLKIFPAAFFPAWYSNYYVKLTSGCHRLCYIPIYLYYVTKNLVL